jgi:predicted DNA-binding transcriptional regulator YafY
MFQHLNLALARMLRLDEALRKGSFPNLEQLAAEFEVSRRTIQRDFDLLREHGAPIEYHAARRGFYYTKPDFRLSFVKLSAEELVAVFLAQRLLQQYGDTPFAAGIGNLFRRCLPLFTGDIHVDPEQLRSSLAVRLSPVPHADAALFSRLSEATVSRRRLRLLYWTAERDELGQRQVDPYGLVCAQGDWLLVAFCHTRQDIRTFAVHRIRDAEDVSETFDKPANFDLADHLAMAFTKVRGAGAAKTIRLHFTAHAAKWIRERQWHPSQELEELPEGGVRLTVRLASFLEIKAFALSWGEHCVVEEPEALRAEIREALKRMEEQYAASTSEPKPKKRVAKSRVRSTSRGIA